MLSAAIDIGTNTAHLIIAEVTDGSIQNIILRNRHYTYLGYEGLEHIGSKGIERLFTALKEFEKQIKAHHVASIKVIATDALRSAYNGMEIINRIVERFNWNPQLISGIKEAQLIAAGVAQSFEKAPFSYLIMDVGGGSVEFILVHNSKNVLIKSLPIGISRLYNSFELSDPAKAEEVSKIKNYIADLTKDILQFCQQLNTPIKLVGSAGTFETFIAENQRKDQQLRSTVIELTLIKKRYLEVITTPADQRKHLLWLPPVRHQYIVVALILIQTIVELLTPQEIIVSKFSLKEGALVSK